MINDQWHLVQTHAKASSGPGMLDGIFETWVDGVKILTTDLHNTETPVDEYLRALALGRNGDSVIGGTIDWGRVRIYATDPGW